VAIAATLVGEATTAEIPRGSARSPNGNTIVLPTSLGLAVVGSKAELWQTDTDELRGLTECVVQNDAQRVACIRQNRVVVLSRPKIP
jgi:hypothetical protein